MNTVDMRVRLLKRYSFRIMFLACLMFFMLKELRIFSRNASTPMKIASHIDPPSLVSSRKWKSDVTLPDKPSETHPSKDGELPPGPRVHVEVVNCTRLFAKDELELLKAERFHNNTKKSVIADVDFIHASRNCTDFRQRRGYIMDSITEEERYFPIAFGILMFKHVEQTERLLRAIYRPQNFYCIHVDKKSSNTIYAAIVAIAGCFDNVFVASRQMTIIWGSYTILDADLGCMEEMLRYKKWRYFINLTGMEFPLKTNGDLVKILKAYNGANDVMGITIEHQNKGVVSRTAAKMLKEPIPANMSIVKGGQQVTLSRAFVEFVFTNKTAIAFRKWIYDTKNPDEAFIQTLTYNEKMQAPGAYLGDPDKLDPPFLNRYVVWDYSGKHPDCHGLRRHSTCVFGVRDLPSFPPRKELFLNKLMLDYQPLTFDCLEEWHFRQIRDEYMGRRQFNSTYYAETPFAKHHRNSISSH